MMISLGMRKRSSPEKNFVNKPIWLNLPARGGAGEAAFHFIEDFVRHANSPDEGMPAPGRAVAIRPAGDE